MKRTSSEKERFHLSFGCKFPCALIAFVPFSEDSLRVRRKVIFNGLTIASLLLALGFPAVQHGVIVTWGKSAGGVEANIYALLAELLGLAVFPWLVREAFLKKILIFFIVLFYGATQYWVVNLYLYLTNFSVTDLCCVTGIDTMHPRREMGAIFNDRNRK